MRGPDRREKILTAASRLLADEGPAALKPDRIAAAAGVSRPVVYDHFAGRDSLAAALIERYSAKLLARMEAAFSARGDDFAAALRAGLKSYLDCVQEEGAGLRTLLGSIGHGADDTRRRVMAAVVAAWTDRIARHTGAPLGDARAAAVSLTASIWALAGLWLDGTISRRRLEHLQTTMALGALDALAASSVEGATARARARRGRGSPSSAGRRAPLLGDRRA